MKTFSELKSALSGTELFAGKTWRIAAEPWKFSSEEKTEINAIGAASFAFYRALETLYIASAENRSILRNDELRAPWVAEILDRGKPKRLVDHARSQALRGALPAVIRPDLLITENGFALTEFDSVPGGIGLTAFLENLYCGGTKIPEFFFNSLDGKRIAVAVSDEAETYRPEFEWLAKCLPENIFVCHPDELEICNTGVFLAGTQIDVVYRFFELFDLENISVAGSLMDAVECGNVVVSPPMRPFQEEKMSLALFHHPTLKKFWYESLGEINFGVLQKIIPATWIVEPAENLPASAMLLAPGAIRDWHELAAFPRRKRNLVLKSSGFSPESWGARSVTIGADSSSAEWTIAVKKAVASGKNDLLYVLQEFRKPSLVDYAFFSDAGKLVSASGRARICPYYFASNTAGTFGGALATLCPADKKIIHGMSVASLVPCVIY